MVEKTAFRNTATTRRTGRASVLASRALVAAALCAASSYAGLVARWDFNNYDPSNPTSAAILAPTVGNHTGHLDCVFAVMRLISDQEA